MWLLPRCDVEFAACVQRHTYQSEMDRPKLPHTCLLVIFDQPWQH